MKVKLNDCGYYKQSIHDELYLNHSFKVYSCLENESRLTQEEKISLMEYPEEIVKEAIDVVLNRLNNKPISEQLEIYCSNKTNSKHSFLDKNKIMVGITVAIAMIAAATAFYRQMPKPGCVERFYDDWTNTYCENGKFVPSTSGAVPMYERFKGLIEQCADGAQIQGCFHKKYYRELSDECKNNPAAGLCDGNYDYQKFLEQSYAWTHAPGVGK